MITGWLPGKHSPLQLRLVGWSEIVTDGGLGPLPGTAAGSGEAASGSAACTALGESASWLAVCVTELVIAGAPPAGDPTPPAEAVAGAVGRVAGELAPPVAGGAATAPFGDPAATGVATATGASAIAGAEAEEPALGGADDAGTAVLAPVADGAGEADWLGPAVEEVATGGAGAAAGAGAGAEAEIGCAGGEPTEADAGSAAIGVLELPSPPAEETGAERALADAGAAVEAVDGAAAFPASGTPTAIGADVVAGASADGGVVGGTVVAVV